MQMLQMLQLGQQPKPEVTNFNVMSDPSKTVPVFTGEKGPLEAHQWLHQLEMLALLHKWQDTFI